MHSEEHRYSEDPGEPDSAFDGLSSAERDVFSGVLSELDRIPPASVRLDPDRIEAVRTRLAHHAAASTRIGVVHRLSAPWLRIAAGFAGFLLLAGGWLFWPRTYSAPADRPISLTLTDGSRVDLNAGAHITYRPRMKSWSRTVTLSGEAFFDVARTGSPFRVKTNEAQIQVLGTRFNVANRPDERATTVYLFEGSVRLSARAFLDHGITLKPGETAMVAEDEPVILDDSTNTHEHLPSWRTHQPTFDNVSLGDVFREIESLYALRIETENVDLDRRIVYLAATPVTAERLLADLCRANGLAYRPIFNGFEVLPAFD